MAEKLKLCSYVQVYEHAVRPTSIERSQQGDHELITGVTRGKIKPILASFMGARRRGKGALAALPPAGI